MITTMYNRKEENINNILGVITGLEFSSHLRIGNYYSTSYYFKDGSEYHIKTDNGKTTTSFEGKGLAARVYRAGCWVKAKLYR